MALSEQEEFELLSLQRQKAMDTPAAAAQTPPQQDPIQAAYGAMKDTAKSAMANNPMSLTLRAAGKMGEVLDKAAYEAGGKVTDVTGSPGLGFATNVGLQAVPAVLGGGIGKTVQPLLQSGARGVMQAAMKPERAARLSGKADEAITTMLEEGINVTKGGREILQGRISSLENEISNILSTSKGTINPEDVAIKSLKQSLEKVKYNLSSTEDSAVISKSVADLLEHPLVSGKADIPVDLANKLKQAIYKGLGDTAYGLQAKSTIERIAEKSIARNLKEGIASAEPYVVPKLDEQAKLINALKVMTPRVSAAGNKDIIGIGSLAPSEINFLTWMANRSPLIGSLVARFMHSASGVLPTGVGAAAGAAAAGISNKRE